MKRHDLDPLNFQLLKSLDEFARAHGLDISDVATQDGLIDSFRTSINSHINHPARVHGFRVEAMFAHVVAAMRSVSLISEEDSGVLFDSTGMVKRPDFRITTNDGEQMFVEVKNYHQKQSPMKPYRISMEYLNALREYATLNKTRLMFAIYWSRWHVWTLIDVEKFADDSQEKIEISMGDAMMANEFHLLGDRMIGTTPPLSLRLYADPNRPRTVAGNGEAPFTVKKACLCCGDVDIDDKSEQRLAWYLMMNSKWDGFEQRAKIEDGQIEFIEMNCFPSEPSNDELPFEWLGNLSQMITSQYLRSTTTEDGTVSSLSPNYQPEKLGLQIPSDYQGKSLKLWIFTMLPKQAAPSEAIAT